MYQQHEHTFNWIIVAGTSLGLPMVHNSVLGTTGIPVRMMLFDQITAKLLPKQYPVHMLVYIIQNVLANITQLIRIVILL